MPDLISSGPMMVFTFATAFSTPCKEYQMDIGETGIGRTLSDIVRLVPISELDGLVDTGGCSRRHRGAEETYGTRELR